MADSGLYLIGLDYTVPNPTEPLPASGVIRLVRVNEEVLMEQEPLSFETLYQPLDSLEIDNRQTSASLLVGSECIKRFEIAGLDERGRRLDTAATGKLVDRHRRGLVDDARKQRVMTALLTLGQKDPSFDAANFMEFVDDRGSFTPKQVAMIFWRLATAGIEYRPTDWKVRMRRDSDLGQLRTMTPAAYRRVTAALTPAQRKRIAEIEERFTSYGQSWRG